MHPPIHLEMSRLQARAILRRTLKSLDIIYFLVNIFYLALRKTLEFLTLSQRNLCKNFHSYLKPTFLIEIIFISLVKLVTQKYFTDYIYI